jgi:gliding motility-associated-like protein
LSDSTVSNPSVIQPNEDITYVVTVIDTNGCVNSDTVYVEVIPTLVIPDGISPNGDGKNDTWMLLFKDDFPNMEVSVYNRWGELLFYDNTGYKTPWDGKYNGEELPVGTYYYVIDLHNEFYPDPYTGPLTIMR